MLANKDKKQDLIEHSKAVANIAREMALFLGLESKLVTLSFWGGLLHDIGKAIPGFQAFLNSEAVDEYSESFPLHHEISWAYAGSKTGDSRLLNVIYWTHGRPIHEDGGSYSDRDEILSRLTEKDQNALEELWGVLGEGLTDIEPMDPCATPDMYVSDGTGNKNTNSELLIVRSCIISADRYVAHVLNAEECSGVAEGNTKGIVESIVAGGIKGDIISCPEGYDPVRYDIQNECAKISQDSRTVVVRAPAGMGKTMIGVLWGLKRGRRVVWVCPRNVVAGAVYKNIITEIKALGLACKVELFLTGQRKECNFEPPMIVDDKTEEFDSDIVVTNIDSVLSPMVGNNATWRLFLTFGADIVLDEFHEFVSDAPMFAAFVIYMRARNRVASNCSTLLLSATPMNLQHLWDTTDRPTKVLPDSNSHYPPAHGKSYEISFSEGMPNPVGGALSLYNSVANAQEEYMKGHYDLLVHSKYTDADRKKVEDNLYSLFGKGGNGVESGKNVSAAPVVQAAMDVSFKQLGDSLCSPESTLQRIGRVCRWGELDGAGITFVDIDLYDNRSEAGAIQALYDRDLRGKWIEFIKGSLAGKSSVILSDMYLIYNAFYKVHAKILLEYLRAQYKRGLEGSPKNKELGLVSFFPVRIPKVDDPSEKVLTGHRNLRNPTGSYFFSVKKVGTGNEWLGPEDVMSEGSELYQKYAGEAAYNLGLLNMAGMLVRLKGLEAAGFKAFHKWVKKGYTPNSLVKWFRLARKGDTPLPDFSREYDCVLDLVKKDKV